MKQADAILHFTLQYMITKGANKRYYMNFNDNTFYITGLSP